MFGCSYGDINRPSTSESPQKAAKGCMTSFIFRPFSYCLFFSKSIIKYITSHIVRLNNICSPSTIFRGIFFIIIYSVKCERSVVSKFFGPMVKRFKIIVPFNTYFNSSAPIAFIVRVIFIVTSLFHSIPNIIKSSGTFAMFKISVFRIFERLFITMKTTKSFSIWFICVSKPSAQFHFRWFFKNLFTMFAFFNVFHSPILLKRNSCVNIKMTKGGAEWVSL